MTMKPISRAEPRGEVLWSAERECDRYLPQLREYLLKALAGGFGSVEITVHEGRVTEIRKTEKYRP